MCIWKGPERSLEQPESTHEWGLELACLWVFCGLGGEKIDSVIACVCKWASKYVCSS